MHQRESKKRSRSPDRVLLEAITGSETDPKRKLTCPINDCGFSFIRAYDLERHLQSAHAQALTQYEQTASKLEAIDGPPAKKAATIASN